MALPQEGVNMALFCDFENVALGVRDAKYEKFDIKPVLERLLLKGSIVVKKAYCDWDRYKGFKSAMHEASFELIEIPHVRQSGKNSADIRLVVDALDLCYTKSHVDTFVIISGDSDFSPLVSKLRENAKRVIGIGVKNSTSELLVANCDEFIFYDDLVREQQRALAKREMRDSGSPPAKRAADEDKHPLQEMEARKAKAIAIAVETFEALASERGESGKIWASVLKSAIKRRKPDFSESYYGFRAFGNLLDEAQARGLLEVGRDDKSGAFVYRATRTGVVDTQKQVAAGPVLPDSGAEVEATGSKGRKKSKGGRKHAHEPLPAPAAAELLVEPLVAADRPSPEHAIEAMVDLEAQEAEAQEAPKPRRTRARKASVKKADTVAAESAHEELSAAQPQGEPAAKAKAPKGARKSTSRSSRSRKTAESGT
ncbi:NYN domain-containing protein [Trinickia sp. EG282A]|uniref:NYN domain-containing protein n=1 Tax=Trinickia sp. EG282A TaxID=3237013 RepID=UPI0034D24229